MVDGVPPEEPEKVTPEDDELEGENSLPVPVDKILKKLEEEQPELFEGLDEERKREIFQTVFMNASATMIRYSRYHSGPLPSPEVLHQYATVIPNGAERIMRMAEKQQDHRMALEKWAVASGAGNVVGVLISRAYLGW